MAKQKLPFSYPSTPPPWLADWPSAMAVTSLFAAGIRNYAARVLASGGIRQVGWSHDSLTMIVGGQRTQWRFSGSEWRRSCSCGYRNDRCPHLYVAARIFEQILAAEGWQADSMPAADISPPTAARPGPATPRQRPAPTSTRQPALAPAAAPAPAEPAQRLEAEVDFHYQPNTAALRFYRFADGRRQLLRLQQLYNLGMQARNSSAASQAWTAEDRRLLDWLASRLRNKASVRQNLNVLKLSCEEFEKWLDAWADAPGRFIERASQRALGRHGEHAQMHIELTEQGEWIEIALLVTGPDRQRYPFHEVFGMLAQGQRQITLDGHLLDLDPPLSWPLIMDIFSRRSPRVRREHVCDHLADLLEGRLDIVLGPAVIRRETTGTCRISAESDGADILVRVTINQAEMRRTTMTAAGTIHEENGKFVITTYTAPELAEVKRFLRTLPAASEPDGTLRVSGEPGNITELTKAWSLLPAGVERSVTPDLQALLGDALRPQAHLAMHEHAAYSDFHLSWQVEKARLSDHELRDAVRRHCSVLRTQQGNWLHLDLSAAAEACAQLDAAGFDQGPHERILNTEVRTRLDQLRQLAGNAVSRSAAALAERLAAAPPPPRLQLEAKLKTVLRHYQQDGFDFLADRCAHRVGAILADDMGLGKTLQSLALLSAAARNSGGRLQALAVCPASVISVWLEQAATFCPNLRCQAFRGTPSERRALLVGHDWNLLVANYAMVRNDIDVLQTVDFTYLILDEAQHIKTPDAQITQAVKRLRARHALALTGTPLENRLLDLWSIMDFLNPGFLRDRDEFQSRYEDPSGPARLARRIAPVMLRRTKEMVAPELPPRTEETLKIDLTEEEQAAYDQEIVKARALLRDKGPIEILASLTRLRQLCCHPALLGSAPADDGHTSAKLETLIEMLQELIGEGHSALVFSQFTRMLAVIKERLSDEGIANLIITGSTPAEQRGQLVSTFNQSPEPQVFLLSLKAAGTGLTLTKADYVFLYDPWWNPAVEQQAIDRTHRIGQDKPVIAYRLVAAGTVEEKVMQLKAEKAELFDQVLSGAETSSVAQRLTTEDLAAILA